MLKYHNDLCVFCDRIIKQRDFPAYKLVLNNIEEKEFTKVEKNKET